MKSLLQNREIKIGLAHDIGHVKNYTGRPIQTGINLMSSQPSKTLETFDNPNPESDYSIRIQVPEFTCLCPKTGQPDFAELLIEYVPDQSCVELKALKMYVWSFRDEGAFHEAVSNRILQDLVAATKPRFMRLTADFNVRGGIYTQVIVEHRAEHWTPAIPVSLPG